MDNLQELIARLPMTLILTLFLASLGFEYYTFSTDPTSDLGVKKVLYATNKTNLVALRAKVKTSQEFFVGLENRVNEIRSLQGQLEKMKSQLSSELDIPGFIKMVVTEAARVGIRVQSIKPTALRTTDLYAEQAFEMTYQGIFAQVLVFLDRLSKFERIIRVDSVELKRTGSAVANYVEIGGIVQLKAYHYIEAPKEVPPVPPKPAGAP